MRVGDTRGGTILAGGGGCASSPTERGGYWSAPSGTTLWSVAGAEPSGRSLAHFYMRSKLAVILARGSASPQAGGSASSSTGSCQSSKLGLSPSGYPARPLQVRQLQRYCVSLLVLPHQAPRHISGKDSSSTSPIHPPDWPANPFRKDRPHGRHLAKIFEDRPENSGCQASVCEAA